MRMVRDQELLLKGKGIFRRMVKEPKCSTPKKSIEEDRRLVCFCFALLFLSPSMHISSFSSTPLRCRWEDRELEGSTWIELVAGRPRIGGWKQVFH